MTDFISTVAQLPTEGVVVETVSPSGQVANLKRKGSLWYFPDGSMYVYYTIKMWRPIEEQG